MKHGSIICLHAACAPAGRKKKLVAGSSFFSSSLFFCFFFSLNLTNWKYRCVNRERDMRIVELSECIFWCVHADGGWILSMTRDILRRVNTKKKRIVTINQNRCKDIERRLAVAVFTYGTKPNGNSLLTFSHFCFVSFSVFSLIFFHSFGTAHIFVWLIHFYMHSTYMKISADVFISFFFKPFCLPCSRAQRSR